MKTEQGGPIEEETSYKKQKINQDTEIFFDKVKMAKRSSVGNCRKKKGRYAAVLTDPITRNKLWLGTFDTVEEASQAYFSKKSTKNFDQIRPESLSVVGRRDKRIDSQAKEPGSCDLKDKISLIGIRRQKNGRYVARITDPIKHKQVHVGVFDTIEQASQAYLSNKSEFEKLSQHGQTENKSKKNCDQIQQPESSSSVMASLDAAASARGRDKRIDSHKRTTRIIGAHWRKTRGNYHSQIRNPITKERIWLATFGTAEEASHAFQSKKLEFQKLVDAKKQQHTTNKRTHSKQDAGEEILVNVKRGQENLNCHERFQPESASQSKEKQEFSCLRANAHGKESSDECNTTTNWNPKAKRCFVGIKRQTDGRYAAVITDRVKHRKVWFGTFDTIEDASQAYLSKKSEFEKLSQQGQMENKSKKNCDQIQQPESSSVVTSLDTASGSERGKRIDSHKRKAHIVGVYKSKSGKYASEIKNPITKKTTWLGTFGTAEEASHAFQSKKLEFQKLVNAKQQQCTNKQTHSKQDRKSEKLVNVQQEHENLNCELESVGESRIDFPISNSSNGGTDQMINPHEKGIAEDTFHSYLSKNSDSQSSKEVELQSNLSADFSAGKNQEGQVDEDLWMGKWIQLPGDRAVMYSLKLGLPIIDNYGSLLGEFSSLNDLSIS